MSDLRRLKKSHDRAILAGLVLLLLAVLALVYLLLKLAAPTYGSPRPTTRPAIEVHFSPNGGCTETLVTEIGSSRKSIDVLAYSFTSKPIADALIAAHKRGVAVRVVLDKSQEDDRSQGDELTAAGITVRIDHAHAIAHNKVLIVDGADVCTGSFNFTRAAEASNAENSLILRGQTDLVREYQGDFTKHWTHSQP